MNTARKMDIHQRLLDRRQRLQTAIGEFKETTQLVRLLEEVDLALQRIDKGSYGVCEVCHERIEEERLMADPLTRYCLGCLTPDQQQVLSREQLLEKVWGQDYYGELRVVDVHVGHIRQKLGDDRFIATVRGVGYRFEDDWE